MVSTLNSIQYNPEARQEAEIKKRVAENLHKMVLSARHHDWEVEDDEAQNEENKDKKRRKKKSRKQEEQEENQEETRKQRKKKNR
jgi:hypothetical protein